MPAPEKDVPPSRRHKTSSSASQSSQKLTRTHSRASSASQYRRTIISDEPSNWFQRVRYTLQDPIAFREFREGLPSWFDEFGAFFFIVLGILTFTALINPSGTLTQPFAYALTIAFGNGAYLIGLTLIFVGAMLLLSRVDLWISFSWTRLLGVEAAFLAFLGCLHLLLAHEEPRAFAREGRGGGHVGWAISSLLLDVMGYQTTLIFLGSICVVSFIIIVGIRRQNIRRAILLLSETLQYLANRISPKSLSITDDLPLPQTQNKTRSSSYPALTALDDMSKHKGNQSRRYRRFRRTSAKKTDTPNNQSVEPNPEQSAQSLSDED
ncbi:MAG: hypothetical protein CUN55_06560 [Phototrophicales bacterium]|nr:MAG: hypothetical protein CUN55_06560 [Phototrophicales bacterium]